MPLSRLLAAGLLAAALAPGCAATGNYFAKRGSDLLDTVRLHAMFGPGIGAKLEVTRFVQLGLLGEYKVFAAGVGDQEVGLWTETVFSWGLIMGAHEEIDTQGIRRVSGSYGWLFTEDGLVFSPSESGEYDMEIANIRGTAMIALGLDLEIRLGQIYDFLAGIFGFDPAGDDVDYEPFDHGAEADRRERQDAKTEKPATPKADNGGG